MEVKPIITFPRWGNYTLAFKTLFEKLGLEVIPPGEINSKTILEGAKLSPEMFCFPLKTTLGSYIPALRKGANTILMVENIGGSCRQRYYGTIQSKVLKEGGWEINVVNFRATPRGIYSDLKKISGASFLEIFRAGRFFYKKLRLIEKIEKKAQYLRPRELEKGAIDKTLDWALLEIERVNEEKNFSRSKKEISRKFSEIKIKNTKNLPKVGLIGEIYTVCDPVINFGLERKLGKEGIEIHRQMDITYHLKKSIFPWNDWLLQRKIEPYLKSTVGGHGRDAIYEMLNYVKKDFDGVIQILPAMCMPEVTIRPILEKIHQKSDIPFLSLSLDEQVAEAGIDTRIEAFVDVVRNYHKGKHSNIQI